MPLPCPVLRFRLSSASSRHSSASDVSHSPYRRLAMKSDPGAADRCPADARSQLAVEAPRVGCKVLADVAEDDAQSQQMFDVTADHVRTAYSSCVVIGANVEHPWRRRPPKSPLEDQMTLPHTHQCGPPDGPLMARRFLRTTSKPQVAMGSAAADCFRLRPSLAS